MDTWLQLRTICDPALTEAPAITTLAFDPYQELLWAGNDKVGLDKTFLIISLFYFT